MTFINAACNAFPIPVIIFAPTPIGSLAKSTTPLITDSTTLINAFGSFAKASPIENFFIISEVSSPIIPIFLRPLAIKFFIISNGAPKKDSKNPPIPSANLL